jgi:hypothetical protein
MPYNLIEEIPLKTFKRDFVIGVFAEPGNIVGFCG